MVLGTLSNWGQFSRYDFYQVLREDPSGYYDDGDLYDAIEKAHNNGADIINISLSNDHMSKTWKECTPIDQPCIVSQKVTEVVKDGTVVVAAAGNKNQLDVMGCPALTDATVCVGGAVAHCTTKVQQAGQPGINKQEFDPPGAYWLRGGHEGNKQGVYCSTLGCGPGYNCAENQEIREAECNVASVNGKPDILAPAHMLVRQDGEPAISEATSWATPFITGQLGSILDGLEQSGVNVGAAAVTEMLDDTGSKVEGSESNLLDAEKILSTIEANTPLEFEKHYPDGRILDYFSQSES